MPRCWEPRRLLDWHRALAAARPASHVQLVAAPVSVVYEEGASIGPGLAANYAAITTVTLGQLSVMEGLRECDKVTEQKSSKLFWPLSSVLCL